MSENKKERIDRMLVDRGFAESRTKAQALIMSGVVLVNEKRVDKPSEQYLGTETVRIKRQTETLRYVGRGGIKLEAALDQFNICPRKYICLDIGSSTGGFTDCLLQNGAAKVFAVDAGTNQLAWSLRSDPRVEVRENVNARYLDEGDFDCRFDLIVVDVSFISVTKILGALIPLLNSNGRIISMIKPQFEVGKGEVGKGGIVKDPVKHQSVVSKVNDFAEALGLSISGVIESPILGKQGNKEFLALYGKR